MILDEKSLVKILKEPKNSLIKQYKRLFEFEDVQLEFKDDAVLEIARKAISKKTGARGLRSILENILKTMFELPDMEDVIKVTVDSLLLKGFPNPLSHMVKNHQHQLHKNNLLLEIIILIVILSIK